MPTRLLSALGKALAGSRRELPSAVLADPDVVLEGLPDGIILWDRRDRLAYCNGRLRHALCAIEPALRAGRTWAEIFVEAIEGGLLGGRGAGRMPQAQEIQGQEILAELAALRDRNLAWLEFQLADGRWIEATDRPLPDGRRMSLFQDVSERKRREADMEEWWRQLESQAREAVTLTHDLAAAKEAADGASKAKSAFLASMSHELRTPLNAVLGFAEIIRDQVFGRQDIDRYSAYAADVHASGQHLLTLINDILDLSKIEAGRMELHEEVVDLDSILASALSVMKGAADSRGVTLRRLARERVALRADAMKLKQCVLNVVSNAIKFTPSGGTVTIKVWADPEVLCIAVVDTGVGIAPADLDKVFQPFGRIDDAYTRTAEGTGLGMPITKSFMELHGGTVDLLSEPGRGTAVHLILPFHRVETHDLFNPDEYAADH